MIGKFDYRKNCSILHFIPQGEVRDGCPVIVFPKRDKDIIVGETYEFTMSLTREATYTIDGQVYRVAHAMLPRRVSDEQEGDFVDRVLHRSSGNPSSTLGDVAGDQLAALRARLASG